MSNKNSWTIVILQAIWLKINMIRRIEDGFIFVKDVDDSLLTEGPRSTTTLMNMNAISIGQCLFTISCLFYEVLLHNKRG